MTASHDAEILFKKALALSESERARLLDDVRRRDAALADDVAGLLEAHESGAWFLEDGIEPHLRHLTDPEPMVGRRVGEHRLLRPLGSGGMGVVYLAERIDDFEQLVAVKLARHGVSPEQLRRLSDERSILASLRHPGIAQLYGGGAVDGRPYLVMEYVDGVPIHDYSDRHALSTPQRLDLLQAVCDAVQFAHRNLIVHRDLKPSNILVTGDGRVKLLDFGIAKLLGPRPHGAAERTVAGFTPGYAAPEQIRNGPIGTTADVFSLGVVAYELLSGAHPFPTRGLSPSEIEQLVCEHDPIRPSAAGSPAPGRAIDPDLDTILLKALRKEPDHRYESPRAFADDIKRYLKGMPVLARAPTRRYRAMKFVRRHRVAASAVAAVSTALVAALAITLSQTRIATERAEEAARQLERAQSATARAARVNGFLQGVLSTANPSWYVDQDRRGPDLTVLDALEEAADRMEVELADDPEVRADIHHTLGDTYRALLEHDRMLVHFQASLDLRREVFEPPHPKIAEALYYLSAAHSRAADLTKADSLLREAVAMQRARDEGNNLPFMLQDLAKSEASLGRLERAVELHEEAAREFRTRFGPDHRYYPAVPAAEAGLSEAYLMAGDIERARRSVDASIAKSETAYGLHALGLVRAAEGAADDAERHLTRAEELGMGPSGTYDRASWVLIPQGRLDEARSVLEDAVSTWEAESDRRPASAIERLPALAALAYARALAGDPDGAEADAERVERELARLVPSRDLRFHWDTRRAIRAARARAHILRGEPSLAEPLLLENLEVLRERGVWGPDRRQAHADLALLYETMGRPEARDRHARSANDGGPRSGTHDD